MTNQSNNNIAAILQNPVINNLISLKDSHTLKQQEAQPEMRPLGKMELLMAQQKLHEDKITFKNKGVIYKASSFELCKGSTKQVFLYALLNLTRNLPQERIASVDEASEYTMYRLYLNDYCKDRRLKDKQAAREIIVKSLEALSNCTFEYKYTCKKDNKEEEAHVAHGNILTIHRLEKSRSSSKESTYWHNGRVQISWSPEFIMFIADSGRLFMPFYRQLLMINTRVNPYGVNLGYKLQTHRFMNNGKNNQNTISIEALLNECDFNLDNKQRTKLVITPFKRDLDKLKELGIIKRWEYCNSYGEPLKEEQLKFFNFEHWRTLFVNFDLVDYPIKGQTKNRGLKRKGKSQQQKGWNVKSKAVKV